MWTPFTNKRTDVPIDTFLVKKESLADEKLVISKITASAHILGVFFDDKEWCCGRIYLTTCVHPYEPIFVPIYFIHLICDKINSFVTSLISNAKEKKWMHITYNSTMAILGLGKDCSYKQYAS